jgi:allantoinase
MKPQAYGPFEYSPIIHRPRLEWPNGAQLALWVIPNIEFFALDDNISGSHGKPPDIMTWSARDYGNRVGVFRLMNVMSRYKIRGTVALNSDLCLQHPAIIKEGEKLGWEWMGHNKTNTRRLNAVPPEEERGLIHESLATIAAASGVRPVGWLGSGLQETWNTLDYLAEEGIEYVCDWVNDDQPYHMRLDEGRGIIALPYNHDINDKPAYENRHYTSSEFRDMIMRQFDVLYSEGAESGRCMAIALHPYLSGVPHRIAALDAAFEYICKHDRVWLATGAEIARHYSAVTRTEAGAAR